MDLSLSNKIAIVTGSSRGLGFASAAALLDEGCRVCICARGAARLNEAAAELRAVAQGAQSASAADPRGDDDVKGAPDHGERSRVLAVQADLATHEGIADVVTRTVEAFGGVDILVNNVGAAGGGGLLDTNDDEWQAAFDQTLWPAIRASRLVIPHMRARGGGAILIIASIYGREAGGRMTYNVVKAAEISLAKSLAGQLAADNIRVNSVAPGSILFPGGSWYRRQKIDPEGIADFIRRELPFGRFGRPEEVGAVVAFLASPKASWISGASVTVDGAQSRGF